MRIMVITTNSGKFNEIAGFFRELPIAFEMEPHSLVEIQASVLEDVIRTKLASIPEEIENCMTDDSGLFVHGLSGFPGVYSAYAYKTIGVRGICKLLEDIEDRSAHFECTIGLRLKGQTYFFKGVCAGHIIGSPRGSGGFGFDPIFVPDGYEKTFAELDTTEKNRISHRGKALQRMHDFLVSYMGLKPPRKI